MNDNSYLNLFFQKFWADIYSEYYYWFEFNDDKKKLSELISAFRQNYDSRFVTHYSMTHPAEDFAESFTAFVLWDEEKIRFFYDFPELVEMRDFIRSNL